MNTIRLKRQDTDELVNGLFLCGKCGRIWNSGESAGLCCGPCGKCGAVGAVFSCLLCQHADIKEREEERMKAARVEPLWDGPVYFPQLSGHNNGFFENIEELLDYVDDEDPEHPFLDWAWGCNVSSWVDVDFDDICGLLEGRAPEDFDLDDLSGINELKAALKAFNKANAHNELYEEDQSFIVPIDWAKARRELAETRKALQ